MNSNESRQGHGMVQDMVVDTVDDQDAVVGKIARSEVFQMKANFRVVHILLFNGRGELLVQQLSSSRGRNPGKWGSSVAGYVQSGESYPTAANRRVLEELGIRCDLHLYGKTAMNDQGSKKFISLFVGISEGPFFCDQEHIAQIEFLSIGTILNLQETGLRLFTPTFLLRGTSELGPIDVLHNL